MNDEASTPIQEDLKEESAVDLAQEAKPTSDEPSLSNVAEGSQEAGAETDVTSSDAKDSSSQALDNEARLEQLEREHETLNSQYMRIAADFDNFRKRQSRDQDDLRLQLQCNTLSSILPVVDNFDRARQQLNPEGEEAQALHKSYQGLYKQLVDVLKQLGVAPMRVVGQTFDPSLHEAVLREPSDELAEDIIVEELQRGYHLNGRVLRHALVKVSMGPGPKDDGEETITEQSLEGDNTTDQQSSEKSD
ncbi:nucleotide exchange factor GrpE [Prochlorococcus marinus]|uniref:Protein GrpE n=1 Tax=Prochlorococcus marinus (strain MIT 9211) TaxID=93059 RepID=GRPE_PROM4|nr:nucleotide exchange factor GrpE [Prochlorococcus marinus]A9B9L4.1 RecName: Full=Protein GrpE; AltName: Full=HSP-70 cofactor [Prochlorococcus marinus str. MIT 9211]ABX07947.1 Heat shock protein GrpE [Prochlorococcus marinus str. MIT 9211]